MSFAVTQHLALDDGRRDVVRAGTATDEARVTRLGHGVAGDGSTCRGATPLKLPPRAWLIELECRSDPPPAPPRLEAENVVSLIGEIEN